MRKELVIWEIKKACTVPMIWVFVLLCIGYNCLSVISAKHSGEYVSYVSDVVSTIGMRMGEEFDENLSLSPQNAYKDSLIALTNNTEDIFESTQAKQVAQSYIDTFSLNGFSADILLNNAERLQKRIDILAQNDNSLDLAAGEMTRDMISDGLVRSLCSPIILQGIILAVIISLYISNNESLSRTTSNVYASRTGRNIQKIKFIAGIAVTTIAYLTICFISVFVFAFVWDLGEIWNSHISSQFHTINVYFIRTPFISWIDFSILTYLIAVLTVGIFVAFIFCFMSFNISLLSGNMYYGFLIVISYVALEIGLMMLFSNNGVWGLYQLLSFLPTQIWLSMRGWFTSFGITSILPFWECLSVLICYFILGIMKLFLYKRFLRKDVITNVS